jgi:hypothetical protein
MDTNKLHHIFANPDHNFDAFVRDFGGKAAAFHAIQIALNQAWRAGEISRSKFGRYEQAFEIGKYSVTVSGQIVNGLPCIGTAWVLILWGWAVEHPHLRRASRRLVDSVFEPPWKHGKDNA